MSLTERVTTAVRSPAVDDEFDPGAEFTDVLDGLGMSSADTGGTVTFHGADPVVPSTLRLGAASAIALAAKSAAVAALWRDRGGEGQDIEVDLRVTPHRLCPFYDSRWETLNGYPGAMAANRSQALGLRFYPTADGRFVMPFNPYPKLKLAAQRLLGVPEETSSVAAAITRWKAQELEEAAAAAGAVMPMLRTTEEFLTEPHYQQAMAHAPLVEITRIGESEPEPLSPGPVAPLSGVRALGMGHVIAGAGAGRALALHGADVLNLWRPNELEHDVTYMSANVGVRSATVDPRRPHGAEALRRLLTDADVFYANRRPGYLDSIGLSADQAAAARPGVIHVTASLNGLTGPWADRVGFDQSAGCLVGMMHLEGTADKPSLPPIVVVNDYIVSWLMAAGAVVALRRRALVGGSYQVHVSLTRAALWILSMGVFDRDYAHRTAGRGEAHKYRDPEVFTADTPLGRYQGVTEQVQMSVTPGGYSRVLEPRGSARTEWLPR